MRSRREAMLERQQQQGAAAPPPPESPPPAAPQAAPPQVPQSPANQARVSPATQCNDCKLRFLTAVAKSDPETGRIICMKCGGKNTQPAEVVPVSARHAVPQAPPPISQPLPPPPETEGQRMARVKAAIEQGVTLSGDDAVLARNMIAEATRPALQQPPFVPPQAPPPPPPQQQAAPPPPPPPQQAPPPPPTPANGATIAMMQGLAQDPADEGTEVTVCWGEEKFSPVQYNSFSVGPFFAKGHTRPGETIYQASNRLMEELGAYATRERSRKIREYLQALQEVLHATGNQR